MGLKHFLYTYQPEEIITLVTPMKIAQAIDSNDSRKTAHRMDKIFPGIVKDLPQKATVMIAYLVNICLKLPYGSECFKIE